jgi:hypothetical protein
MVKVISMTMANFYNRNEKVFGWSIEVENS